MYRPWVARALALCALGLVVAITVGGGTSVPRRALHQPGPLVVVGMPALQWSQVTPTGMPHLWGLATEGAVAAQATMVLEGRSCSVSSWLTLSAGTPTGSGRSPVIAGPPGAKGCASALPPRRGVHGSASYAGWSMLVQGADTRGAPVKVGLLASSLGAAGQCVTAVGPDAGIGAADASGVIARYAATLADADLTHCPVTLIALGGPDDVALGQLLQRLPGDATVVVSGIADEAGPVTLHPLVVAGPGVPHGLLTSSSTRQPGFVQTSDLTALVLSRLGSGAPHLADGRAPAVLASTSATGPLEQVRGLTRALDVEHAFVGPFFALFLGGCLLAVGAILLGWWLLQGRLRTRGAPAALRAFVALVAAMVAATPVAAVLVGRWSWWQADSPRVALALGVLGTALLLALVALLGPWRRRPLGPTTVLAAVTVVVIGADVVNGSRLQFVSLLGLQPVFGGRYYGQGNVGFALYATAALLLATLLAGPLVAVGRRRTAAGVVAVLGIVAVVVDGYPSWGADGGGPLAMIPAFGYLALRAAGAGMTGRRWALIAATAVVVVLGFATADYVRAPADRTHIGIFVDQFLTTHRLDGLQRIWSENWRMLTGSWIDLTVIPLVLLIVLVLARPSLLTRLLEPLRIRMPLLGEGLVAIAACWLVGFAVNDSGTAIPPTGLLLLGPLLLLLAVSPIRSQPPGAATPPGAAPAPGGEPVPDPVTGTAVSSGTAATVAEA